MKIIQIYKADLLNGVGLRNAYFFSGCEHHCPGCFNEETWDPDMKSAREWTEEDFEELIRDADKPYISGITLTGGDPMHPTNLEGILDLCKRFKEHFGNTKTIWCYTGYKWEQLEGTRKEILGYLDVLCDGPYKESKKSPEKPWVGSRNQRVIDVKESLKQNKIILL